MYVQYLVKLKESKLWQK